MAMLNQRVLVLVTPCKKNSREQKTCRMIFLEIRGEKLFRSLVEQGDSGEDWNTTSCRTGITLWEMKKHEKKHPKKSHKVHHNFASGWNSPRTSLTGDQKSRCSIENPALQWFSDIFWLGNLWVSYVSGIYGPLMYQFHLWRLTWENLLEMTKR